MNMTKVKNQSEMLDILKVGVGECSWTPHKRDLSVAPNSAQIAER